MESHGAQPGPQDMEAASTVAKAGRRGYQDYLREKLSSFALAWSQVRSWHSTMPWATGALATPQVPPQLAWRARVVFWAPTATLSTLVGAAVVALSVSWLVDGVWGGMGTVVGKVLLALAFVAAGVVLMVWYATMPEVSSTLKRLALTVRACVMLVGLLALLLAAWRTVGYFTG